MCIQNCNQLLFSIISILSNDKNQVFSLLSPNKIPNVEHNLLDMHVLSLTHTLLETIEHEICNVIEKVFNYFFIGVFVFVFKYFFGF